MATGRMPPRGAATGWLATGMRHRQPLATMPTTTPAPTSTPRELMRLPEVQARRAFVDLKDPAVLDNIDDPERLARLRALTL